MMKIPRLMMIASTLISALVGISYLRSGPVTRSTLAVSLEGHPRLFFGDHEIENLRNRATTTHAEIWTPIQDFAESQLGTTPPASAPLDGSEDTYRNYGNELIPLAFVCATTNDTAYCDLAKIYLLTYASWSQWGDNNYRDLGLAHMLLGNSIAYDWLYSILTPDERQAISSSLASWAQKMYEASSQPVQAEWNNWWSKSYLQNHYWINNSALGIAGLVLLGEGGELGRTCLVHAPLDINLREGPGTDFPVVRVLSQEQTIQVSAQGTVGADGFTWWHLTTGEWVRSDVVGPLRDCTGTSITSSARTWVNHASHRMSLVQDFLDGIGDGSWHEGIAYQSYGLTLSLPFLTNLRRLQGIDLLPHTYLANYVYWRIYNFLPGSTEPILAYGDWALDWGNSYAPQNVLRFVAAEYQNGHAEWMAQQLTNIDGRYANVWNAPWYVFEFLYYDSAIVPQSPEDLTLDREFPDLEGVIWRTGWDKNTLIFGLKTGVYGGRYGFDTFVQESYPWEVPCETTGCQLNFGHDHDDINTFYLYSAGVWLVPETVGAGRYETSAHNTLLIDGQGQFRPPEEHWGRPIADFSGQDGFLGAVASTANFAYATADATRRYGQIQGIQDVTRHIVFVRPDYLIVLDHVAADTAHHYEWVTHLGGSISLEGDWVRSDTNSDQILGMYISAPNPFQVVTGSDGRPYVRVGPALPVAAVRLIQVLYPTTRAAWDTRPTVTVLDDNGQAVVVRVQMNDGSGRTDDIVITYAPSASEIHVGPYRYDGQIAVVSSGPDHTLKRLFVYGGTFLSKTEGGSLVSVVSAVEPFEAVFSDMEVAVTSAPRTEVRLYAPGIERLMVDRIPHSFTRSDDYIVWGD